MMYRMLGLVGKSSVEEPPWPAMPVGGDVGGDSGRGIEPMVLYRTMRLCLYMEGLDDLPTMNTNHYIRIRERWNESQAVFW